MLEKLMRSDAEVKTLGIVLFEDGLHLREIARRAGISPPEAKRELDNLVSLGIIKKQSRGNQVLFTPNTKCPFFNELRGIYIKTEGVAGQLRKSILDLRDAKYAFIYGSMANGNFSEKSDVDVLIIGNINEEEVVRSISNSQKGVGREINWVLWSERDFANKLKENGSFINSLLKGKKIWLAGDYDEFERITSKAVG